jgi:hypothetical protein
VINSRPKHVAEDKLMQGVQCVVFDLIVKNGYRLKAHRDDDTKDYFGIITLPSNCYHHWDSTTKYNVFAIFFFVVIPHVPSTLSSLTVVIIFLKKYRL